MDPDNVAPNTGPLATSEEHQARFDHSCRPPDVEAHIAELNSLNLPLLRSKWKALMESEVSDGVSPNMLRAAIAYRLQERLYGGLSKQTKLRLKALSASLKGSNQRSTSNLFPALVKPGTKFLREWQNKVHEVQALGDGRFVYKGQLYRSLTVIAREITGTHQSGPKFFGLAGNVASATKEFAHHG